MKKILFSTLFLAMLFLNANAQVDGKAIGLRFGGFSGVGAEVSYQHPLGNANRLEADLGLSNWGVGLTGVYQWVWDLSALSDGFNWYAGVGGTLGLSDSNFGLGVVGQVGIEYNFNIPLQLSLDYRPTIYVLPSVAGGYDGICLSVRYKF
ncbi:MAG: hypothetical protein PHH37_01205 [Paludibacter sp.]|nr:hypothetical protein [Paludibacter sp.]